MPNSLISPDKNGFYGKFGGAYVPELLYANINELQKNYKPIISGEIYLRRYHALLRDYVGRPTPLYYAERLSEKYKTHIFLKREDLTHTGAHKINNAVGQILLAEILKKKRIIAETGAGQHGVAVATVCAARGMDCIVYMGETDMQRQAPNVERMKMLGAEVRPVTSGNKTLKDAVNEALRDWINNAENTFYLIGSAVGPHPYPDIVARLQSVISHEIKIQLNSAVGKTQPDAIIACVGGGSNAAGAFYHFADKKDVRLISVEAEGLGTDTEHTAASLQKGSIGILHGSKTVLMQDNYGQVTEPYSLSAGLDYPGIGPLHAHLNEIGRTELAGATDNEALDAARELAELEGIIPALESAHALAVLKKIKFRPDETVVINLSGRGDKDMQTYIDAG